MMGAGKSGRERAPPSSVVGGFLVSGLPLPLVKKHGTSMGHGTILTNDGQDDNIMVSIEVFSKTQHI